MEYIDKFHECITYNQIYICQKNVLRWTVRKIPSVTSTFSRLKFLWSILSTGVDYGISVYLKLFEIMISNELLATSGLGVTLIKTMMNYWNWGNTSLVTLINVVNAYGTTSDNIF